MEKQRLILCMTMYVQHCNCVRLIFNENQDTHNDASNDEALRIKTSLAETMTTVKTNNIPNVANGMIKV
jgi:hypothetical protein